ncbi:MAG TPA: DUF2631 domain-containing protein [Dietzia timorensis]|uniref:DUF2631 domain-containing protein n=1 Tax=Dietzia timorensis TaxID=499555 RepID=A0A921F5I4_9ACTN|nr:DUF2631 domain-containing protein [Dietzia timorensis]HJE91990.1 DUF2631 domain-containing protein [Dietzia timorensis]
MSSSDSGHVKEIVRNGISSIDEPSVNWGWHGFNRKFGNAVGISFAVFMLLMLFGNHIGNVENIYLVSIAIAVFVIMAIATKPHPPRDSPKRNKIFTPTDPMHYANN